jgi:hypothetical protein
VQAQVDQVALRPRPFLWYSIWVRALVPGPVEPVRAEVVQVEVDQAARWPRLLPRVRSMWLLTPSSRPVE